MGIIIDVALSIPIGLVYNMIIHKIGEIFNNDINYRDKIQRNLLLSFGGGILGIILASFVFGKGKYKNRAIKIGLYIGSVLLFFHSIGYNWTIMGNDTKFVIMLITLISLMYYTYSNLNSDKPIVDSSDDYGESSKYLPAVYTYKYPEQFGSDKNNYNNDYDRIINY